MLMGMGTGALNAIRIGCNFPLMLFRDCAVLVVGLVCLLWVKLRPALSGRLSVSCAAEMGGVRPVSDGPSTGLTTPSVTPLMETPGHHHRDSEPEDMPACGKRQ